MSTRCQIVIRGCDFGDPDNNGFTPIHVYKHGDGYPAGVLPVLRPLVEHFNTERGRDDAYLLAQILRAFAFADLDHEARGDYRKCLGRFGPGSKYCVRQSMLS